jgi:hypothetical protein
MRPEPGVAQRRQILVDLGDRRLGPVAHGQFSPSVGVADDRAGWSGNKPSIGGKLPTLDDDAKQRVDRAPPGNPCK